MIWNIQTMKPKAPTNPTASTGQIPKARTAKVISSFVRLGFPSACRGATILGIFAFPCSVHTIIGQKD